VNAYIYKGGIYCWNCAEEIMKDLDKKAWEGKIPVARIPKNPSDTHNVDSENYPAGPYNESDEEGDSPQHCAECGIFFENQLTSEGEEYVIEAVREDREKREKGKKSNPVVREWEKYYDYLDFDRNEEEGS